MTTIETALITAAAKETSGPAKSLLSSLGRAAFDNLASKFASYFQGHIDATADKCSVMKNILYKDQSVDFRSKYVHVNFKSTKSIASDKELLSRLVNHGKILVSGTAGAGKTMFMRWAALTLIDGMKRNGRIPLYLELRYMSKKDSALPLERYVWERTSTNRGRASFGGFKKALESGLFVILLDALDEVSPVFRPQVTDNILRFIREYPRCSVAISTRPEESVHSIQELAVYRTTSMDLSQIKEVIGKLDYDPDVKQKLLRALDAGLYNRLQEFLSNPLLATIMLLTFDFGGDIPTNLTSFYKQAFEVLYQRHDATKGAFKREQYSDLSMDAFQRIFAAFCFQTYMGYTFKFSDSQLIAAFRDASEYSRIEVDPMMLVKDTMESVCLIQQEGLENVFVHRSFQEYFCALFISTYREDDLKDVIDTLVAMERQSNVLKMLYEISPEVIDYEWLLPRLDELVEDIAQLSLETSAGLEAIWRLLFEQIGIGLSTGDVEFVTWNHESQRSLQPHGYWLSLAQDIKQIKPIGYGAVFGSPKIWDSLAEYLETLSPKVRPAWRDLAPRIEDSPFDEDSAEPTRCLRVSADDAVWLRESGLPARFESVRKSATDHRDQIRARRAQRRSTVGDLLRKKRLGTSPI